MADITYPTTIKTDFEKLCAVYSLVEQMRLEHNRQGEIARGDWGGYRDKWYLYGLRPERLGGNVFWGKMLPLVQEYNRLREEIRKATYTDEQWRAFSDEDREVASLELYGDRAVEKEKPTEATTALLDELKAVALDSLGGKVTPDPTEDFTTYTEVDPNSKISVTSSKVEFDDLSTGTTAYVRKSFGAEHFGDFEHLLEFGKPDSPVGKYHSGLYWAVADDYPTKQSMYDNDNGILIYTWAQGDNLWFIDAENSTSDGSNITRQITYYLTVERSGTTAICKIYTDSERTNLHDTLSVTCTTTKYEYVYAPANYGHDSYSIYGYVANLDLQEVAEKTSSDSGSGADAKTSGNPEATLIISEAGSGADSKASNNPQAAFSLSEAGSGTETVRDRTLILSETGSGAESSRREVVWTAVDAGAGVEASVLIPVFFSGDMGLGSELSRVLKDIRGGDEGGGSDALRALIGTMGAGSDMRLHGRSGKVRMPSKGVNI
jgi:hypothetical protein